MVNVAAIKVIGVVACLLAPVAVVTAKVKLGRGKSVLYVYMDHELRSALSVLADEAGSYMPDGVATFYPKPEAWPLLRANAFDPETGETEDASLIGSRTGRYWSNGEGLWVLASAYGPHVVNNLAAWREKHPGSDIGAPSQRALAAARMVIMAAGLTIETWPPVAAQPAPATLT